MSDREETRLWEKLRRNRDRLQKIADLEAQGAWSRSGASDGSLDPERQRLIDEAEEILKKLEDTYKNPQDQSS